jgi:cation:H+ antiporter
VAYTLTLLGRRRAAGPGDPAAAVAVAAASGAGVAPGIPDIPPSPAGDRGPRAITACVALVVAGLALLTVGADFLVEGAVGLARAFGVSELVIGLTLVALGTSLPEVATSIVAAARGQRDIAVGNVVGSCTFNSLCVLGLAGLVAPGGIAVSPSALRVDVPVMLAASLACVPVFLTGMIVSRREGAALLAGYAAYLVWMSTRSG